MPERFHAWPEGHWDWLIHLSHKHGLACGPLIFVGGQVDKDAAGEVLNLYDSRVQTRTVNGGLIMYRPHRNEGR